jgi:hypothetical protein
MAFPIVSRHAKQGSGNEKDVIEIACQLSLPPDVAVAQLSKTPGRQDLANRCDWSILGCQSVESLLPG